MDPITISAGVRGESDARVPQAVRQCFMAWHVAVQGRAGERPIVVMGHSFVVVHKVGYWCRMKGVSIERVRGVRCVIIQICFLAKVVFI